MAQWPDVYCSIKVIGHSDSESATVRYLVINHGNEIAGPLTVLGSLFEDGARVKPGGRPNVIPAQRITLRPREVWKLEYPVAAGSGSSVYEARLLADGCTVTNEEDSRGYLVKSKFRLVAAPR